MSLRGRFLLVSLLVAVLPLASLAIGLRRESARQLRDLYGEQVTRLELESRRGLAEQGERIDHALLALRTSLLADNQFRVALLENRPEHQRYRVDLGERVMPLTGLHVFEIQDAGGRIVTSGHFREQFDRTGTSWPSSSDRPLFAVVAFPDGPEWMRIRTLSLEIAGKSYQMMGGSSARWIFSPEASPATAGLAVHMVAAGRSGTDPSDLASSTGVSSGAGDSGMSNLSAPTGSAVEWFRREVPVALFCGHPPQLEPGTVVISASATLLDERLARLDRWFLGAALATVLFALLLAFAAAGALSRPLRALAEKTTHVRIGRRYVNFRSDREDELGDLSRFIGAMVDRLQGSAEQLREAERTATVGEIARQVHHDIRNGLTPIRNVMRHLSEVSRQTPEQLASTFAERSGTIDAGLQYLDELSSNYARLTPRQQRIEVDLNAIVHAVADPLVQGGLDIRLVLSRDDVRVLADPVGLRRIVENLVRNASESLESPTGWVEVRTEFTGADAVGKAGSPAEKGSDSLPGLNLSDRPGVTLSVQDTGSGMTAEVQRRVFEHFYSTKLTGVGLGLGIVKRLMADFGGRIDLESTAGQGTTFRLWFPGVSELGPGDGAGTDPR